MALDFPASPTNGQTFGQYIYDTSIPGWRNVNSSEGIGLQFKSGLIPVVPTSISVGSGSGTVSANGLVFINGATSVQLNGVFTDTYKRYKIVLSGYSSSSEWLNIRYVTGTSPNSSGNYYFAGGYVNTSGIAFQTSGAPSTYGRSGYAAGDGFMSELDVVGVRETDRYARTSARHDYGTLAATIYGTTYIVNATTFDGIQFFHATGANLNMNVQIYAYN